MSIERIAPMLTVDDVDAAARQHSEVLGMELVMNLGWVAFLADDAGHQLGLMIADASAPVNPDVSVFVDDVDAAHRSAARADAEIVHPLTDEPWGVRRFFYREASGRVVNVGMHR